MSAHHSQVGTATIVDRFAEACVTSAARRWPVDLGDSMAYEWRAELAALRTDRALGAIDRFWQSVKFAASLALSPPVEKENHTSAYWRDRAPGLGQAVLAWLGVLGVAMLAAIMYGVASYPDAGLHPLAFLDRSEPVVNYVFLAIAIVAMAWIGTATARRGVFGSADGSAFVVALRYTAPIGLAVFAIQGTTGIDQVFALLPKADLTFLLLTWVIATTVSTGAAHRLARAGRRGVAWVVAIVGSLAAIDVASIVGGLHLASQWRAGIEYAPAWFPLSIISPAKVSFGHFWPASGAPTIDGISYSGPPTQASFVLLSAIGFAAGPLLLCSAFIVGYAMRASRVVAVAPAVKAGPVAAVVSPVRAFGLVRVVGLAGVVLGLYVWAFVAGNGIAPHAVSLGDWNRVNLRTAAIVLVTIATVVLLAGRGPVALPVAGIFAVLYAADCVVVHGQLHGQLKGAATAAVLLVVGASTVVGGWWLSARLAGSGTRDRSARRALVGAAIAGPVAIPTTAGLFTHPLPASFLGLSYLVAGALWLAAITAALASRRTPMSVAATIAYVVVPLAPLMLFVSGDGEKAFGVYRCDAAMLFTQIPLAVVVLAAAQWNSSGVWSIAKSRSIAQWLALGIAGAFAAFPLGDEMQMRGILSGVFARYEPYWDVEYPNHLVLALALGIIVARLASPPSVDTTTPEPVDPHDDPQGDLENDPVGLAPSMA